jgi:GNAT superfamily N-acetyltransferase
MTESDIAEVVALQSVAFPPPFDPDKLWAARDLEVHLDLFPDGQWIAEIDGKVVGSCSNSLISESRWRVHENWDQTTGGAQIRTFDPEGSTIYGLDISVAPSARRLGIGRAFYNQRFQFVRERRLRRYGTGCRLPDFAASGLESPEAYVKAVQAGILTDRTLTPLLAYGLTFIMTIENYMEDPESGNAAALLEWIP